MAHVFVSWHIWQGFSILDPFGLSRLSCFKAWNTVVVWVVEACTEQCWRLLGSERRVYDFLSTRWEWFYERGWKRAFV